MNQIRVLSESFDKELTVIELPLSKKIYGNLDRLTVDSVLPSGLSSRGWSENDSHIFLEVQSTTPQALKEGCAVFLRSLLSKIIEDKA